MFILATTMLQTLPCLFLLAGISTDYYGEIYDKINNYSQAVSRQFCVNFALVVALYSSSSRSKFCTVYQYTYVSSDGNVTDPL